MIVGTLTILPPPERRLQVLEVLRSVEGPVRAQPGCLGFHIYEEQGAELAIVLVERWDSEASLTAHICSATYPRILAACELSATSPEFRFENVSTTEGIERIERSLGPGGATPSHERTRP